MKWLALLAAAAVVALSGAQDTDDGGELWAVLVAGSNTWFNYRHQVGPLVLARALLACRRVCNIATHDRNWDLQPIAFLLRPMCATRTRSSTHTGSPMTISL